MFFFYTIMKKVEHLKIKLFNSAIEIILVHFNVSTKTLSLHWQYKNRTFQSTIAPSLDDNFDFNIILYTSDFHPFSSNGTHKLNY